MNNAFAKQFGQEWVAAWNTHDLVKILSHYTDDFVLTSPVICKIAEEPSGVLKGKKSIEAYWSKALQLSPDLNFKLIAVFTGINSVIVHYEGHRGLSSEIFYFNSNNKVYKSYAHYQ